MFSSEMRIGFVILSFAALLVLPGCGEGRTAPGEVNGEAVFRARCAICHGLDGRGSTPTAAAHPAANLADGVWAYGGTHVEVVQSIRNGIPGSPMLGFGRALSEEEIHAVADYVRHLPR